MNMTRSIVAGRIAAVVFILLLASALAPTQNRPAAWDTRVRATGQPAPAPQDTSKPRDKHSKKGGTDADRSK
jgi:hypothetical protein